MKKIDFYSGFEGEKEIVICSSDIELRIWDGYFELMMEILFDLELACFEEAFGLAAQWCICKDWCEKTEIDDLLLFFNTIWFNNIWKGKCEK